jgi:GxxExxY protein
VARKAEERNKATAFFTAGDAEGEWRGGGRAKTRQRHFSPQGTQRGKGERSGRVSMDVNQITGKIIEAALKVHTALGPGLLESAYEACLLHELNKMGLQTLSQLTLPVRYDGIEINTGYRLDLVIEDCVIVELKAVDKVLPIHEAQLLSYLKLSNKKVGLLINFNVMHLKNGIKRIANGIT